MARQTTRRRTWTGVALIGSLVAVSAGAWGLQRWAPFADEVTQPSWPPNIQPVADFVEDTTGTQFVTPITVEYIADREDYATRVQPESLGPTDEELADAAIDEGVARALGLWEGNISVVDLRHAYETAAPIPVTWFADADHIVVNAPDASGELSPLVRAELVVRLTQALDNQLYRTVERMQAAPTSQEYQALLAVAVGHAVWMHDLYVGEFDEDDLDSFYADSEDSGAEWSEAMAAVPVAYRAIRAVAQQIGPMFVEVLTETGRSQFAKALTTNVPTALDQIALPVSKHLRRDPLERVDAPPGPAAADVQFDNQVGPFATYLLFSTGLPLNDALTAADGWGNDRYTAYVLDDRVCVDVHFVADSPDDADRMMNGLNGWAQARPAEADVLVGRNGNDLYASACDPGVDVRQIVPTEDAVQHYLGRSQELQFRADESGDPEVAECVALTFFAVYDLADFDSSFDYFAEFEKIEASCLRVT